jgi:hypothetical protein
MTMRGTIRHFRWISMFVASAAFAEGRTASLYDVAVIENGQGAARVLFRAGGIEGLENVAISRATLTVAAAGQPEDRALEFWIHPVTRPWDPASVKWERGWSRPGGDFDDELLSIARLDLRADASEVAFDVTGLMKEIVEAGMEAHGFILTLAPADGVGIRVEDLSRLGSLADAALEIEYRRVPPRPSRRWG